MMHPIASPKPTPDSTPNPEPYQAFATEIRDPDADDNSGELMIGTVEHMQRLHTQKVEVRVRGFALFALAT